MQRSDGNNTMDAVKEMIIRNRNYGASLHFIKKETGDTNAGSRPILYIDVDGVLFGVYYGHPQPRPNIIGFLDWAVANFECRWMTCWDQKRLQTFMDMIHGPHIFKKIVYFDWHKFKEKDDAIDLTEDFYWIEDGDVREKLIGLTDPLGNARYIEVDAYGRDELYRVQRTLDSILQARTVKKLLPGGTTE